MATPKITVKDLGYATIISELLKLETTFVTVGVHQAEAGGQDARNNALIGSVHEFGTSPGIEPVIPERSWLRSTMDSRRSDIGTVIAKAKDKVVSTKGRFTAEDAGKVLALWIQGAVVSTIQKGREDWPSLAESTVRRKKSSRPLIHSGQFVGSIRAVTHTGGRPSVDDDVRGR